MIFKLLIKVLPWISIAVVYNFIFFLSFFKKKKKKKKKKILYNFLPIASCI